MNGEEKNGNIPRTDFLPLDHSEAEALGWDRPDFVYVCGDAYVDHPSFGSAIISRYLEAHGFRVAMLCQPDFHSAEPFTEYGRPRLGFLVSAGNLDSMVANYTAAKHRRSFDYYSPGGKAGLRPDRAVTVYCNRIREAYGDVPIIIGGLEASLRRFAHYDFWDGKLRRSVLFDSRADLLSYGMGERSILRIAQLLNKGVPVGKIRDVRGTCYICKKDDKLNFETVGFFEYEKLKENKKMVAEAFGLQYREQDAVRGRAIAELYGDRMLVQNPPAFPLERDELDEVAALPYTRAYHPSYESAGGIPAIEEVRFSITHNRGCFGGCSFCAIAFHQGRAVRSRSIASCVREAEELTRLPSFKGYIHDVGGPTANFRSPACQKQLTEGVCASRRCLTPKPCPNLNCDQSEYLELLRAIRAVPGVKKVFVRSGIRHDYLLADKNDELLRELCRHHVSGQLRAAPEHICTGVLRCMGKPDIGVYEKFVEKFDRYSAEAGREQYVVPYLISGHPGSDLSDAVKLAVYLRKNRISPEQVQQFYPTPGTLSTVMYYTGFDPLTGKEVRVMTDEHECNLARALLQSGKPENAAKVREALRLTGNEELIGYGSGCLVPPEKEARGQERRDRDGAQNEKHGPPKAPDRRFGSGGKTEKEKRKEKMMRPGTGKPKNGKPGHGDGDGDGKNAKRKNDIRRGRS